MTLPNRERTTALTCKTKDLMDVWLQERKDTLAKQLVANAAIKQRWMESNPIEISQRRQGYHANAQVQANTVGVPLQSE